MVLPSPCADGEADGGVACGENRKWRHWGLCEQLIASDHKRSKSNMDWHKAIVNVSLQSLSDKLGPCYLIL